jgi:hypothetical protein
VATILGWVLLAAGAAAGVLAGWVLVRSRRSAAADFKPDTAGLVLGVAGSAAPKMIRPGMLDALGEGEIGLDDLLVTVVDLAARGYLQLQPIVQDGDITDWLLSRTAKPDTGLQDFERTLLRLPFESRSPAADPTAAGNDPWLDEDVSAPLPLKITRLSSLVKNRDTTTRALTELQDATEATGWFAGNKASNIWAPVGAVVILAGLMGLAAMFITGMRDFTLSTAMGFVGGGLLVAAGVLLASTARLTVNRTDAGQAATAQVERYGRWLAQLQAHQILPDTATDLFNANLAAALELGLGDQFAAIFEEAAKRMAAWGNNLPLDLGWLDTAQFSGPVVMTPTKAVQLSRQFIADGQSDS